MLTARGLKVIKTMLIIIIKTLDIKNGEDLACYLNKSKPVSFKRSPHDQ